MRVVHSRFDDWVLWAAIVAAISLLVTRFTLWVLAFAAFYFLIRYMQKRRAERIARERAEATALYHAEQLIARLNRGATNLSNKE